VWRWLTRRRTIFGCAVLLLSLPALPVTRSQNPLPSAQETFARQGLIRENFFESNYQQRYSPNNVIGKLFPALSAEVSNKEVSNKIDAPHLGLAAWQSDRNASPGTRVMLGVEVHLSPGVHVYSPGVQGYKPIELAIAPAPQIELAALSYPHPKILYLPAIKQRVPVFEGTFRITQELQVSSAPEFSKAFSKALPASSGQTLVIKGQLKYQACDAAICYVPVTIPLAWQLTVAPLDLQRAPDPNRHK
jgi:Disulphide bond corrector protein DsbC